MRLKKNHYRERQRSGHKSCGRRFVWLADRQQVVQRDGHQTHTGNDEKCTDDERIEEALNLSDDKAKRSDDEATDDRSGVDRTKSTEFVRKRQGPEEFERRVVHQR